MSRPALPGSDDAETRRKGSGKDRVGGDVPPGWPSRVLGDRVVAERSGSVSGVAPSEPASAPVGRARELTAIATAMATAGRGTERVVHLVGEPGIGKTTLAEHAAALASAQGWVVAWGRAWAQAAAPAGTRPAAEEVAWLHRASGGNPFFVDQLVRWSAARERAGLPDGLPVSAAVRRVVGERLAGLGGEARRVVTVAAVAGDEADQEVLATVAGLPPDRFADAVTDAVAAGILWRRSSEHPSCGFVHALLREAARAAVDADVRRALHLEIAGALEALPGRPGRLAEVAHHYRAALPAGDPQVTVDRTVAAGEQALRVFAHEAAIAQCTAGLTAIGSYGSGGPARLWQARLLAVLGEARRYAGDLVGARQTLVEAHALAAGVGDSVLAADAAIRMPRLTQFLVPDRELESMLTAALEGLGDAAPALRARLLARRAVIAEDAEDRQARSDQAGKAARRLGDAR